MDSTRPSLPAPPLAGLLEAPAYVDDLERADRFYGEVLGLARMTGGDRLRAYSVGPGQVLLVCRRGGTDDDMRLAGGLVPGHRGEGPGHFAFRIAADKVDDWRARLEAYGVPLYSTMRWPRGGVSLYVHDPDGNVVELASPGLWPNY